MFPKQGLLVSRDALKHVKKAYCNFACPGNHREMLYGFKAAQEKLGRLACSGWVAKKHFQNWVLRRCFLGTRFIWEVNLNPMQITPAEASYSSQYGSAWLWLKISITCKIDVCLFLNCNYMQNLEGRCLDFNNLLPLRGEPVNQFSSNISHMLDIEN